MSNVSSRKYENGSGDRKRKDRDYRNALYFASPAIKWLAFLQNLSVGHDGNWERYPRAPP